MPSLPISCNHTDRPRRSGLSGAALLAALMTLGAHANPVAHWSFDGATVSERLKESYGATALDASEVASNSWSTRAGFGDVLANGSNSPYLSVSNHSALDFGAGDFGHSRPGCLRQLLRPARRAAQCHPHCRRRHRIQRSRLLRGGHHRHPAARRSGRRRLPSPAVHHHRPG